MATDTQPVPAMAMDWSGCPLVEVIEGKVSGVPLLKGTRMPADVLVENYADGLTPDEIAEVFALPLASVRSVLNYAMEHAPINLSPFLVQH